MFGYPGETLAIAVHILRNRVSQPCLIYSYILYISLFSLLGFITEEEQIVNDSDSNTIEKRLLTREAYWSAQLCPLKPYGLNKRCEFRSKNRINFSN